MHSHVLSLFIDISLTSARESWGLLDPVQHGLANTGREFCLICIVVKEPVDRIFSPKKPPVGVLQELICLIISILRPLAYEINPTSIPWSPQIRKAIRIQRSK